MDGWCGGKKKHKRKKGSRLEVIVKMRSNVNNGEKVPEV